MFEIAQRYGISLESLIRANPQITDPNRIFPGKEICIPVGPRPMPTDPYTFSPEILTKLRAANINTSVLIAARPSNHKSKPNFTRQEILYSDGGTVSFGEEPVPLPHGTDPCRQPEPMPPYPSDAFGTCTG